jgi:streptogramin lyase
VGFSNHQNAYGQSNNTTIQYVPLQDSKLEVTLVQGHSTALPVQIRLQQGDRIINLGLMLSPWPDGIYGIVSPQVIQNTYTANTTLQIFVQPYVKPGNYTLGISAQGWVNDTSGKPFMVNSEPPTPLAVRVLPYRGEISLTLGDMADMKTMNYCYNNGCGSFTSIEKYLLLIKSNTNTIVSLSGPDVPHEKWIHFDPVQVNAGPAGTPSTMTIGGMVTSLTGNNPLSTKIFTIRAESKNGSTAQVFFPYEDNFNMSVLHNIEPINFKLQWDTNIDGNNSGVYGVVYDPGDNSSIPVTLSVAGLEHNNKVIPLPPSVDVDILKPSFVLNSSQVYYIPIIVKTSNATVGNYYVAINETIGGSKFVTTFPFTVMPNICLGGPGMCGPQPTPEEKEKRQNLDFPFDVTTDTQGDIYVADSGNDRMIKFDPSGNYLMQFGISGKDDGQFKDPRGIAVDTQGNIYVADTGNERIQKFDPSGKFLLRFGAYGTEDAQFHGPYSVTVDKPGFIYVADVGNARIQKFDSHGNFILKFGARGQDKDEFDGIERIVTDSSGYLYVTSIYQGVQKFDSNGNFVQQIQLKPTLDGNNTPDAEGIALDKNGEIYVAGYNQARIQKFDPQGNFKYEFGSFGSEKGQFDHPGSISLDTDGNILVADSDNNRIEKLDSSGKFVSEIHDWNITSIQNSQQKIPEFSLAVPVLLISIVSTIAFYRIKIRK